MAISFAKTFDSELILLTVMPSPRTVVAVSPGGWIPTSRATYNEDKENIARRLLDDAVSECRKNGIRKADSEIVHASRSIVGEIIEFAIKRKIDLIVIGTRGLGGFRKMIQGSVSSGVVTHAHCNVIVVR